MFFFFFFIEPGTTDIYRTCHTLSLTAALPFAPLDNLLFSRRRLAELFGFDYKFEAYTPIDERRFYFALPILHRDRLVGLVDAKLDRNGRASAWNIVGLRSEEHTSELQATKRLSYAVFCLKTKNKQKHKN